MRILKEEKMRDSLTRIKMAEKEVALVKIADRITNLQTPPASWPEEKIKKYGEEANLIYEALKGRNDWLDKRLLEKIQAYPQPF